MFCITFKNNFCRSIIYFTLERLVHRGQTLILGDIVSVFYLYICETSRCTLSNIFECRGHSKKEEDIIYVTFT